jgi:NitT/TauT family transport system ATP-binding protein
MLVLENIGKTLGGRTVLANVSLRLERGGMTCLVGPSGIGKTTILEIAAGLIKPDRGRRTMTFTRVGYGFQDDVLIPWLSALGNLEFALAGYFSPGEARSRTEDWLERFGLHKDRQRKPGDLSSGMRRRLNLARSLALGADLVLLDEPFAFLDGEWQKKVAGLCLECNRASATAFLLVSHQLEPLHWLGCPAVEIKESPIVLP